MNENSTQSNKSNATDAAAENASWEKEVLHKLLSDNLKEQRARRRWSIFFKFVGLFIFLMIFGSTLRNFQGGDSSDSGAHAALIKVSGTIQTDGKASAENIIKALQKAYTDEDSIGIILRINSPGGSPVQAGQIYDEIMRLRQLYPQKPIHVVVEEMCASGGYYIAAAAENIYVDKASIVGSIGVMINGFGFTGLMDKLGIERRLMTSGKNKGFLDPFSPENEQQKQFAQNLINEVHEQFITVVRNGRGSRLKENDETFSGAVWTGTKAIEMGLADGLGSVDSVAREVFKITTVVDYTEEERLSDRVLKKLGASAGEGAARYSSQALHSQIQ